MIPAPLDIGFRVLKLVDSPMVDASKPAGETTQTELSFSSVKDGVKDDATLSGFRSSRLSSGSRRRQRSR